MIVPLYARNIESLEGTKMEIWVNKEKTIAEIPFLPYFYSKERRSIPLADETLETVKFISDMKERSVYKYSFSSVKHIPDYRDANSMECDIPFVQRVAIDDEFYFKKFPQTDLLDIFYFDIEVDSFGKFPKSDTNPIIAICYAFNDEEPVVLEIDKLEDGDYDILTKFMNALQEKNPDIITTYFGNTFDIPYVLDRLAIHNISTASFTRAENSESFFMSDENEKIIFIKGRCLFDIFDEVKRDQSLFGIADRKMKTVAEWFNLSRVIRKIKGFEKYDVIVEDVSNTRAMIGTKRLHDYVLSDVLITRELSNIYLPNVITFAEMIGLPLNIMMHRSSSMPHTILSARNLKLINIISDAPNFVRYPEIFGKPEEVEKYGRKATEFVGGTKFQGAVVGCNLKYQKKVVHKLYHRDYRCLPRGELVFTTSGYKNIEDIEINDELWTGRIFNKVADKVSMKVNNIVELQISDGTILRQTNKHRLRTNRGVLPVEDIHVGDKIFSPKQTLLRNNKDGYDELFELLGIFVCEGSMYRKKRWLKDKQHLKGRWFTQSQTHCSVKHHEVDFKNHITGLIKKYSGFDVKWKTIYKFKGTDKEFSYLNVYDTRKEVYDWFKKLLDKYYSLEEISKSIPRIKGFLAGCFKSDACWNVARHSIMLNTTDYKRIQIIMKCLQILGIHFSCVKDKKIYQEGHFLSYRLEICYDSEMNKIFSWFNWDSYRDDKVDRFQKRTTVHRLDGKWLKIVNKVVIDGDYEVYDLTMTDQTDPYFVHNGYETHNSLYPSIIMYFNISPETISFVKYKDFVDKYFNVTDYSDYRILEFGDDRIQKNVVVKILKKEGFATREMKRFYDERVKIKDMLEDMSITEEKRLSLKSASVIYKVLLNSVSEDTNVIVRSNNKSKLVIKNKIYPYANSWIDIKKIKDVQDGEYTLSSNSKKQYNNQFREVKKVWSHIPKYDYVYKIKTQGGKIIEVTPDHSVYGIKQSHVVYYDKDVFGKQIKVLKLSSLDDNKVNVLKGSELVVGDFLRCLDKEVCYDNHKMSDIEIDVGAVIKDRKNLYVVMKKNDVINDKPLYKPNGACYYCKPEFQSDNIFYKRNTKQYYVHYDEATENQKRVGKLCINDFNKTCRGVYFPCYIKVDEVFVEYLSWFIAEGYAHQNSVYISQAMDGKYFNDVKTSVQNFVQNMGINYKLNDMKRKTMNIGNFCIHNKIFNLFMTDLVGKGARKKIIPSIMYNVSKKLKILFLDVYNKGDGTYHKGKDYCIKTASNNIMNAISFMCGQLKFYCAISQEKNGIYCLCIKKKTHLKRRRFNKIKSIEKRFLRKNEKVYDLSVDENENFYAGQGWILAHNSYFGTSGSSFMKYANVWQAITITAIGRFLIRFIIKMCNDNWCVLDTDGVFLTIDLDEEQLSIDVNKMLKDKFNVDAEFMLEGDFYEAGYALRMKNYVLLKRGKLIKHGVSFKASSKNHIFSDALDKIAMAVLKGEDVYEIAKKCYDMSSRTMAEFVQRTTINRPLVEYASQPKAGKKGCLQVQVGKQVEGFHESPIVVGDSISYVKTTTGYEIRETVSDQKIDKEYYRKQVLSVLKRFNQTQIIWQLKNPGQKTLGAF